ncbi:MAG: hypothetical protein RKO24_12850 [Candidatus Competibacter sp.]|nr:hypothetical protein [Candidatus Competibacter sp.]
MVMDIKTYLDTHTTAEATELAEKAGTKLAYLKQIGWGLRRPAADVAIRLHAASNGLVHCCEVRPDLPWPAEMRAGVNPSAPARDAA